MSSANPAIQALTSSFTSECVWAQVLIIRRSSHFELRHLDDRDKPADQLQSIPLPQLRDLATHTAAGAYRPLKSAPTLRSGWRSTAADPAGLLLALNDLYPGSVADWFAAQSSHPPVTSYREFTNRQSGMYRITTYLDDLQAGQLARAVCHPRFCLKQRLWTVGDAAPDLPGEKSAIPCLEPCAVVLETARQVVRLNQDHKQALELAPGEWQSLALVLQTALNHLDPAARVADFASPANPRRLQLLLEKLRQKLELVSNARNEE